MPGIRKDSHIAPVLESAKGPLKGPDGVNEPATAHGSSDDHPGRFSAPLHERMRPFAWPLIVIAFGVYILWFRAMFDAFGPAVGAFYFVPVVITALFFGTGAGVAAGLSSMLANGVL